MILVWLLAIPIGAGIVGWIAARWNEAVTRWLCLAAMLADLGIAVALWVSAAPGVEPAGGGAWLLSVKWPWIPAIGVSFQLAMDGLSLLMVLLTGFLGVISVAVSWGQIERRVGFYYLNLMLVLAGVIGVFLALDLFLFYFFWELMLVPMYFLIDVWGHENRHFAAIKFFLFTQASGLLMLVAIIGVYFAHGATTGVYTFDYTALVGTAFTPLAGMWLMLGFFIAFAVKIPAIPVHTWLPDAHTEAPTAGSVILAGLLLKTGAYGILRFVVPVFPNQSAWFHTVPMILALVGIIYGAVMAFAQDDFKRLVAYTSISHMGFVLLGIYAWTRLSLVGAVVAMIAHGISTGALFVISGYLQDRTGTRDMRRMGGLWASAPRLGGATLAFAMASLGLPGLGNFVGEFLVLLGVFQVNAPMAIVATGGLIVATVYSLWMMYAVFFGAPKEKRPYHDLRAREGVIMAIMIVAIVALGLYPRPVLDTAGRALDAIRGTASAAAGAKFAADPGVAEERKAGTAIPHAEEAAR